MGGELALIIIGLDGGVDTVGLGGHGDLPLGHTRAGPGGGNGGLEVET